MRYLQFHNNTALWHTRHNHGWFTGGGRNDDLTLIFIKHINFFIRIHLTWLFPNVLLKYLPTLSKVFLLLYLYLSKTINAYWYLPHIIVELTSAHLTEQIWNFLLKLFHFLNSCVYCNNSSRIEIVQKFKVPTVVIVFSSNYKLLRNNKRAKWTHNAYKGCVFILGAKNSKFSSKT